MRNRRIAFILICLAIVATAELSVLLTTVTPAQATRAQLWVFFICITVLASLLLAPIWHSLKRLATHRRSRLSFLASLRQVTLLSSVVSLAFFLNALHVLTVWNLIPLLIAMVLVEFFFQADKSTPNTPHVTHP